MKNPIVFCWAFAVCLKLADIGLPATWTWLQLFAPFMGIWLMAIFLVYLQKRLPKK